MSKQKTIYIKIIGTGIHVEMEAVAHELLGLPAGTYHKMTLKDGTTFLLNDFGIRSVTLADSPEQLK